MIQNWKVSTKWTPSPVTIVGGAHITSFISGSHIAPMAHGFISGSVKAPFITNRLQTLLVSTAFFLSISLGRCHSFFSREASRSTYMGDWTGCVFPIWDMFPICGFQYVSPLVLKFGFVSCLASMFGRGRSYNWPRTLVWMIALCQKLMLEFRPQFKTLAGADLFDTSNLPSRNSGFTVWLTR